MVEAYHLAGKFWRVGTFETFAGLHRQRQPFAHTPGLKVLKLNAGRLTRTAPTGCRKPTAANGLIEPLAGDAGALDRFSKIEGFRHGAVVLPGRTFARRSQWPNVRDVQTFGVCRWFFGRGWLRLAGDCSTQTPAPTLVRCALSRHCSAVHKTAFLSQSAQFGCRLIRLPELQLRFQLGNLPLV
jgi:hypothetical protein